MTFSSKVTTALYLMSINIISNLMLRINLEIRVPVEEEFKISF